MPTLTITNEFIENDGKTTLISRSQAETAGEIEKPLAMAWSKASPAA